MGLPNFLNINGPVNQWARNLAMQSFLLLICAIPVVAFQSDFGFILSLLYAPFLFIMEYPIVQIVTPFAPWHNFLLRSVVYMIMSILLYIESTVLIFSGLSLSLSSIVYLWAWGLDESWKPPQKKR